MLGFHGCDQSVRDELVRKPDLVKKAMNLLIGWEMAFISGKTTMQEL